MDEYWDIYDINRNKTGRLHKRGLKLKEGEYHLVVDICTINNNGEILLTKRHPNKPWGNYWECTGGSVVAGEDSITGAKRELFEEIGIKITQEEIEFLGTIVSKDYFTDTYLVRKNVLLSDLKLQSEEVIDAKWVNIDEFDTMCMKNLIVPTVIERFKYYKEKILNIVSNII